MTSDDHFLILKFYNFNYFFKILYSFMFMAYRENRIFQKQGRKLTRETRKNHITRKKC